MNSHFINSILNFSYFRVSKVVALIVISYTADRVNSYRVQQRRTQEERDDADRNEEIKLKKD